MNEDASIATNIAKELGNLGAGNISRHLDEFTKIKIPRRAFQNSFINIASLVVTELRRYGERRSIVWTISVGFSVRMRTKVPSNEFLKKSKSWTVYLLDHNELFSSFDEEYKRRIYCFEKQPMDEVIYRCWRDTRSAEIGWEFNRAVYFISYMAGENSEVR